MVSELTLLHFRSCKLPAKLKEYVLPHQKPALRKGPPIRHKTAATRTPSQAEDTCCTGGHSKQHPQLSDKKLVVKLLIKAPSTDQSIVPQLQAKPASSPLLQSHGVDPSTRHIPQTAALAHMPRSSKSSSTKAFKAAPVERPVTRRFRLQQHCQLKVRIKLKRTAEYDERPQRASTLKHQQKRHGQQVHDDILKHDSSFVNPSSCSKACLLRSSPSKLPDCAQAEAQPGIDTKGTSPMTQVTAPTMDSQPKNDAGSRCCHLQPFHDGVRATAEADTQPTVPKTCSMKSQALWSDSKPPVGPFKHQSRIHALPAEHGAAADQANVGLEHRWGSKQAISTCPLPYLPPKEAVQPTIGLASQTFLMPRTPSCPKQHVCIAALIASCNMYVCTPLRSYAMDTSIGCARNRHAMW